MLISATQNTCTTCVAAGLSCVYIMSFVIQKWGCCPNGLKYQESIVHFHLKFTIIIDRFNYIYICLPTRAVSRKTLPILLIILIWFLQCWWYCDTEKQQHCYCPQQSLRQNAVTMETASNFLFFNIMDLQLILVTLLLEAKYRPDEVNILHFSM